MKRKRIFSKLLLCAAMLSTIGAGVLGSVPLPIKAAGAEETYEAKIGDAGYEELEEAFANAQTGDTITVLKDCSVSETLVVTADNITLTSEDTGNPATISRDEEFAGKNYNRTGLNNVLLSIEGSLTMRDIILDGGAELDEDFNNSGQIWDSPLVYVRGTLAVEDGTVLQNNYNTDGNEKNNTNRSAGAIHVASGSTFTMSGGLIRHCYTNGSGGGIQTLGGSVTITSGTITECNAYVGGAMEFIGPASVSGMTISGNKADAAIVSINGEVTLSDCLIKDNKTTIGTGAIGVSMYSPVTIEGCTITGNHGWSTSAISYSGTRTAPLTIRDCTIRGNVVDSGRNAAIEYMTKAPLILDGQTVIEDNTVAGGGEWDIYFYYNDTNPIKLGSDFESDSTFVMWGYDFTSGTLLVDAASNGKEADASQFIWRTSDYKTEEKEGNIYLTEIPVTYRVVYVANNNASSPSAVYYDPNFYTKADKVSIKDRAELLPYMGDITRAGHDFIGWNTMPDGSGTDYLPGQEINLTGDLYLFAKWEQKDAITITYVYNGGEGEKASEQAIPETNFTFPDATRKGYSFKGWYEDDDLAVFAGNAGEEHPAPDMDTSYYAAWENAEATVSFDADGGTMEGGDVTAKIGDSITLPDCTKDGYEFVGWYDDDSCVGQAGEEYIVTDDVTLKAHYERKKATITFDADGGTMEGGDIIAKIGDDITLPDCTKDGYEFVGWYDGDSCVGQVGEEYTVTDDVTLKAHYERKKATVTFDADGGTMEGGDVTAKIGDSITLPDCTKDGYEFVGWYDGDSCVGKAGEEYTVTDDVTLKAHYEKIEDETVICTITFDADGGDVARKSIRTEKGSTIILPNCSKTGYEFLGWFLASDDNTCAGQAGEEFTVQQDITLKAHFEKKEAVKVTITFDADGGKEVNPITASKGEIIRLPRTEKEGYSFLGWYTEKDGGILLGIPGSEMKAVKDMTAYALWEKETEKDTDNDADPETCKVTFHAGQGKIKVKEITIIKGGSLYLPMPEREGYDFAGWYLDDGLTQFAGAYRDTYRITKDTDFYAKWEKSKDNGGDNGDSGNSGNTGDESGNGADDGDNAQDDNNSGETLNTYTIKYDANGGKTKNASVKIVVGGSVKLPSAEREGYTFKGWYTDRQVFIGTEGETYKPNRSISLYARWEKAESDSENNQDNSSTEDTNDQGNDTENNNDKDNEDTSDKNSTENTNDNDNGNTSDKNKDTSGTVSGNTIDSPSDKDTDTKTEGGNGSAGKGTGQVIQTGYASPIYLLAALGMCGIMLAAASVHEGKKDEKKCL